MSAAIHRSTPSLSVPQSQNTAPVLEFNCLYTHDLRRKQKRWQDGFLRFHTFNKRIMVYDVPRNYIGDSHWPGNGEVQEGDEMTLDKGGVLVQVADIIGRTETDLTELRSIVKKATAGNSSSPLRPAHDPTRPAAPPVGPRAKSQTKHRSLNALLGTPRGPIGKAAISKSPFEERQANLENTAWEAGRPPKRPRVEATPTREVPRPNPPKNASKELPLWARTSDASKRNDMHHSRQQPVNKHTVIDLSDEPEPDKFLPGFSSDALDIFSSPIRDTGRSKQQSGPVSDSDKRAPLEELSKKNASHSIRSEQQQNGRTERSIPDDDSTTDNQAMPTLRLAAAAPKKKTLLCQGQLSQKAKKPTSPELTTSTDQSIESSMPKEPVPKTPRQELEARLAKIKSREVASNLKSKAPENVDKATAPASPPEPRHEIIHTQAPFLSTSEFVELDESPVKVNNPPPNIQPAAERSFEAMPPPPRRTIPQGKNAPTLGPRRAAVPPVKEAPQTAPPEEHVLKPSRFKNRGKGPQRNAVNLDITSNGTSTVMLRKPYRRPGVTDAEPPPAIPAKDPDPWTREAFDLFDWRPPGWDEENWTRGAPES